MWNAAMKHDSLLDTLSRLTTLEAEPFSNATSEELPRALALGESRLPKAFAALRQCWDDLVDFTFRKTLLLAIGLIRSGDAFNFLLTVVRDEGRSAALRALEALAIYAGEEKQREQIRAAVEASGDEKMREAFTTNF